MKKHELFATPVYQDFFPCHNTDEVIHRLLNRNNEYVSLDRDTPIYKGHQVFDVKDEPEFADFVLHVTEKLSAVSEVDLKVINSWINISGKGDGHNRHDHYQHNIYWNVVWYLKYEMGNGAINFYNESHTRYMTNGPLMNKFIEPMEFMWVAFPAWLNHETQKNAKESQRVSAVFDLGV